MPRSITMCPSRMPRTASATGSLWSSPSTSTVKSPVIVPSPMPGPAGLADEPDPRHVGRDVARQHREEHRLADAGAGEDADALAAAARGEGVERAHAKIERRADAPARMGGRRRVADRTGARAER